MLMQPPMQAGTSIARLRSLLPSSVRVMMMARSSALERVRLM